MDGGTHWSPRTARCPRSKETGMALIHPYRLGEHGPTDTRTMRQLLSVVEASQFLEMSYSSPKKLIHSLQNWILVLLGHHPACSCVSGYRETTWRIIFPSWQMQPEWSTEKKQNRFPGNFYYVPPTQYGLLF